MFNSKKIAKRFALCAHSPSRSSKKSFWGCVCSKLNNFLRTADAQRARSGIFLWIDFFCQDGYFIFIARSSKKLFWGRLCSKRNTFSRAAGAWRTRSGIFLHRLISFVKTVTLFLWSIALKSRFEATYVVSVTLFRARRACRAREAGFFLMNNFFLPRRLSYFNGSNL